MKIWSPLVLAACVAAPFADDSPSLEQLLEARRTEPMISRLLSWQVFLAQDAQMDRVAFENESDTEMARAISESLDRRFADLVSSGKKVGFRELGTGKVHGYEDGVLSVEFRAGFSSLNLSRLDLEEWQVLLRKSKKKTDQDQMAVAALSLFLGDQGNFRKARRALSEASLTYFETWEGDARTLVGEIATTRKLRPLFAVETDLEFTDGIETQWAELSQTWVGKALRDPLREMYYTRIRRFFLGQEGVSRSLACAATVTGDSQAGFEAELTFDFDQEPELQEFTSGALREDMLHVCRYLVPEWTPPKEAPSWGLEEGVLVTVESAYAWLRIPFTQFHEIEASVKVPRETTPAEFQSALFGLGIENEENGSFLLATNFARLVERQKVGLKYSPYKEISLAAGERIVVKIQFGDTKITMSRNDKVVATLTRPSVRQGRLFLLGGDQPCWRIDRIIVRGTLPEELVQTYAEQQAQKSTQTLFNE